MPYCRFIYWTLSNSWYFIFYFHIYDSSLSFGIYVPDCWSRNGIKLFLIARDYSDDGIMFRNPKQLFHYCSSLFAHPHYDQTRYLAGSISSFAPVTPCGASPGSLLESSRYLNSVAKQISDSPRFWWGESLRLNCIVHGQLYVRVSWELKLSIPFNKVFKLFLFLFGLTISSY